MVRRHETLPETPLKPLYVVMGYHVDDGEATHQALAAFNSEAAARAYCQREGDRTTGYVPVRLYSD